MKTRIAAALLTAALPALAQTPERWDFPFDARDWKLAAEHREGRLSERVYVAPGESEYFWSEKIVVGHQRLAFSPDDYLTGFIEHLNEHCRPYKMKPLQQEPRAVLLQWEGDCRITGQQFEYRRIVAAKDGVHILAYAAKTNRLSEARREAWLAILREARLK
jgi:hypothetical protein